MNHPNLFVKVATIGSTLILGAGFILYQTKDVDRLFATTNPFLNEVSSSHPMNALVPEGIDTSEIQKRLLLLDSTQRTFLGLLSGQFPPPEGTSYFDRGYVDSLLRNARERSKRVLFSSSKSGSVLRTAAFSVRMIDSVRIILLSDTTNIDAEVLRTLNSEVLGNTLPKNVAQLIYPWAGSEDLLNRLGNNFPMSPLGTYGFSVIDTLHIEDTISSLSD